MSLPDSVMRECIVQYVVCGLNARLYPSFLVGLVAHVDWLHHASVAAPSREQQLALVRELACKDHCIKEQHDYDERGRRRP